jgi:hypothetical protein
MASPALRILAVTLTVLALVALVWLLAVAIEGNGDDGPAPWAKQGAPDVRPQPLALQ